jgi:endonuclease/exonuclease/phosphatase family metal-dependent hydrolase
MTYNVHRCIGTNGRDSIADIGAVCADAAADVIAMQELDAPETDDDGGAVHHARDLAARLGMKLLFCRTFRRGVGYYGHALLSRFPVELKKVTTFPAPAAPGSEPRGAIWARVALPGATLDVVSTHLGLSRRERAEQSAELLGEGWLGNGELSAPCVLCGDLNAVPNAATYRRLSSKLKDAQRELGGRPKATFPSLLPVLRIDHVFVTPDVRVRAAHVPWDSRSRRASDHLPLIVDIEV